MQDGNRCVRMDERMNLTLGMSSRGLLGTPALMSWSPVGHHVMAFIPVLYLSKVCKNKIKVLYVCTLCHFHKRHLGRIAL